MNLIIAQCSLVSNPNRLALTDVQSNSFDSKSFLVIPRWITVVGLTNTIASVDGGDERRQVAPKGAPMKGGT